MVKGALQKFKRTEEPSDEIPEDFHQTPPGEFPKNGPKSSIVALVMFYLSKIVTLVGFIMVGRAVFFEEVKMFLFCEFLRFKALKNVLKCHKHICNDIHMILCTKSGGEISLYLLTIK